MSKQFNQLSGILILSLFLGLFRYFLLEEEYPLLENKIDEESQQVTRRITVPNSILGGFAQFKINYIFTQFPSNEPGNEGVFLSGNLNTERIFVPAYIPPVITEEEILELVIDDCYFIDSFSE